MFSAEDLNRIGSHDTTPVSLPLGSRSPMFHFTVPQRPLKIKFIDADEKGKHPFLGTVTFSVSGTREECSFLIMDLNTNEILIINSISWLLLLEQVTNALGLAYRGQPVTDIEIISVTTLSPNSGSKTPPFFCRHCAAPRSAETCWKCSKETFVPHPSWNHPALPDVEPIRKIAYENGYAITVHGSQERDLDLVAIPWVDTATPYDVLIAAICLNIDARQIGACEQKPFNRIAVTLQINGWFRPIDLSIIVPYEKE